MRNKSSILDKVIQQIYDADTFDKAKTIFTNAVNSSRINSDSKRKMLSNIQDIENKYSSEKARLDAIKIYATNSMFEKKGMSAKSKYRY